MYMVLSNWLSLIAVITYQQWSRKQSHGGGGGGALIQAVGGFNYFYDHVIPSIKVIVW